MIVFLIDYILITRELEGAPSYRLSMYRVDADTELFESPEAEFIAYFDRLSDAYSHCGMHSARQRTPVRVVANLGGMS